MLITHLLDLLTHFNYTCHTRGAEKTRKTYFIYSLSTNCNFSHAFIFQEEWQTNIYRITTVFQALYYVFTHTLWILFLKKIWSCDSSMLLHVTRAHSFTFFYSIPVHEKYHHVFIQSTLMSIKVVPSPGLWQQRCYGYSCTCLLVHMCVFRNEITGCRVRSRSALVYSSTFSK